MAEDQSETPFRALVLQRPGNSLSPAQAGTLYVFLVHKLTRQHYTQKFGDKALPGGMFDGLLGYNNGTTADELPGAFGRFGYEPTNPIPVMGIMSTRIYLGRLRSPDGQPVTWQRVGAYHSAGVSPHPVDEYRIIDAQGTDVARLFVSPYEQTISTKAPQNFFLL